MAFFNTLYFLNDAVSIIFDLCFGPVSLPYPLLVKSVRIRGYSGPYFPTFGLNTERYSVSLRIRSECGKIIRIFPYSSLMRKNTHRNNSEYEHFLHSVYFILFAFIILVSLVLKFWRYRVHQCLGIKIAKGFEKFSLIYAQVQVCCSWVN